jgi:hypothetical protein
MAGLIGKRSGSQDKKWLGRCVCREKDAVLRKIVAFPPTTLHIGNQKLFLHGNLPNNCANIDAIGSIIEGGVMLKYDFSVKTREGQKLESIVIGGKDREDAERKLRQMYRHCEVLRCDIKGSVQRPGLANSVDDILSLISR